jgi:hypothetical protein
MLKNTLKQGKEKMETKLEQKKENLLLNLLSEPKFIHWNCYDRFLGGGGIGRLNHEDCPLYYKGQKDGVFQIRYKMRVWIMRKSEQSSGYAKHILRAKYECGPTWYSRNYNNS